MPKIIAAEACNFIKKQFLSGKSTGPIEQNMKLYLDSLRNIWGIAGLIVGHPMDTLKVRQQILHSTFLQATINTLKYDGIMGLYKGFGSPLLMIGPSNAAFFGCYGNLMKIFQNNADGRNSNLDVYDFETQLKVFTAGSIAGAVQVLVTSPMEQVKILLQAQMADDKWMQNRVKYAGIWDCIKQIYKIGGIKGVFRGTNTMMLRDLPTSGIYALSYEIMARHKYDMEFLNDPHIARIIAGGTAGVASWFPVIPLDVVKSRIQGDDPLHPKYNGIVDCFVKSYREYGLKIFLKGSPLMLYRAFWSNAAIFVTYEQILSLMRV